MAFYPSTANDPGTFLSDMNGMREKGGNIRKELQWQLRELHYYKQFPYLVLKMLCQIIFLADKYFNLKKKYNPRHLPICM